MKKIATICLLMLAVAAVLGSCTTHESCAAYNAVELEQEAPAK